MEDKHEGCRVYGFCAVLWQIWMDLIVTRTSPNYFDMMAILLWLNILYGVYDN